MTLNYHIKFYTRATLFHIINLPTPRGSKEIEDLGNGGESGVAA